MFALDAGLNSCYQAPLIFSYINAERIRELRFLIIKCDFTHIKQGLMAGVVICEDFIENK